RSPADPIDYAVGFDRLAPTGATVGAGAPLARLHANDEAAATEAENRLRAAYAIGASAPRNLLILEELFPESKP
ncbi:MAG TPA: thymidine phosphorylase, partial [Devosiaceae bacterium]|nr:thymidine phosphorylase [Devosiaceae bacterium]